MHHRDCLYVCVCVCMCVCVCVQRLQSWRHRWRHRRRHHHCCSRWSQGSLVRRVRSTPSAVDRQPPVSRPSRRQPAATTTSSPNISSGQQLRTTPRRPPGCYHPPCVLGGPAPMRSRRRARWLRWRHWRHRTWRPSCSPQSSTGRCRPVQFLMKLVGCSLRGDSHFFPFLPLFLSFYPNFPLSFFVPFLCSWNWILHRLSPNAKSLKFFDALSQF